MPEVRTYTKAFAGGEVTPQFWGRVDDAGFQMGLALCRNFIVLPHGPISNRPGTRFVRATKDSTKRSRLIPFEYSSDQTMALEFGHHYIRFHTQGLTLLNGPVPYEVVTTYDETELFDIHYTQSADVLTLVHPNHPPRELRRLGALNWVLSEPQFVSTMAAPTGVGVVATSTGTGLIAHTYVVTSVGDDYNNESLVSAQVTCSNNLNAVGSYNTVTWSAVTGATRYRLYKLDNGLFGYIGETPLLTFRDDNITPLLDKTPPEAADPFAETDNDPGAVGYFQQRRVFGGTKTHPQTLWMTRPGTESNLTASIPARDDDAISFRIAAQKNNLIRHIVPLADLIIMTSSMVWRVITGENALTANSFAIRPQSGRGASNVQPVIVDENVVYAVARGGHMREMGFSNERGGYTTGDLSLRAPHLFDKKNIVDMDLAQAPYPIIWSVSSNGWLLGLTYVPEQKINAWHRHDTAGLFESVCAVPEGDEDAVYVIVQRTINGSSVRYVERFAEREDESLDDAYFVDAGVSYSGAPITTVTSGLAHLEGEEVAILGDGAVRPRRTVTGGSITLDHPASTLHIGLPYQSDAHTLPMAFEGGGAGQGRRKNTNQLFMRVDQSSGFYAGPTLSKLTAAKIRTNEVFGQPPSLQSREIGIRVQPEWNDGGQLYIRNDDPTPLTVVSISLGVEVAGG